ncbi:MAG: zinc-ribbon domain-containing protein [Dehalococcoidia bacterium]|nr:zinc-ribbon domain-containing protein [Dehalococcoidia bacterium]
MFCSKCGAENPEGAKFCSKCGAGLGVAAMLTEGAAKPEAESSTGMSANTAGLLCYLATWITGIIFAVLEKKSTFVKFHAWQSIMTFGVLTVVQIILSIISAIAAFTFSPGLSVFALVLSVIVGVITVGLWIALMILAYQGKMWKVPLAGDWAEKQASK